MRNPILLLSAALLVTARAGLAQVAQPPQTPQPPETLTAPAASGLGSLMRGTVDIGGLFTAADGDEARYGRYRDLRDGVYTTVGLNRESASYLFDATAAHVGYRDQRYSAALLSRRVTVGFTWTSSPLNYSSLTRTPFDRGDATLTLPDAAQAAVQGPTNAANDGTAVGVPCAPGAPPASCGTVAQAAQAKATPSIYNALASPFDLRHQRDTAAFGVTFMPSAAFDVDARFLTAARDGEQPWNASFAFNNAVEVAKPLDERTNDATVGATWASQRATLRLGWDGSWFNNDVHSLLWDNPIRLTDFSNGLLPPNGPFDPSGYSNGNGAAQGRQAMAPSNRMHVVSAVGMYKFPRWGRTVLNGTVQLTSQNQDETLIPWTTNAVILSPVVFAAYPHLAQLPRATAQAEARGINTLLNFSTRPVQQVNVVVRYRYNDRDVQTPPFDATQYVRFDAAIAENEEAITHQFDTTRQFFDATVSYTPFRWGTARLGYGHEAVERHGRGFSDVGEHILRLSFDTLTSQFFTVRASFDHGRRRGEGFVEPHSWAETEDLTLITGFGGAQPTLRYYDEADRNRTRTALQLTVFPRETFEAFVQFAGGRDRYLPDDETPIVAAARPGELFGLHESDVRSWNVGLNVYPSEVLSAGASYGRDRYSSLQRSRAANPPPDPSWVDPNRDWTLDNDDDIDTFNAFLDVLQAIPSTDVRFSYDYSASHNSFVHGGPRVAALTALNQFIPLPTVENAWHRLSADVQYFFTSRAGVGVGYAFEKLDITDFNTIDSDGPVGVAPQTEVPRFDWLGGLLTGYGNRPYTGNTAYVRLLYRF